MGIDDYLRCVELYAERCEKDKISPQDLIENIGLGDSEIQKCIAIRRDLIDPREEEFLNAYLEIGLFLSATNRNERISLFALCFDIQYALDVISLKRQCEQYRQNHVLFHGSPDLFSKIRSKSETGNPDLELININAIQAVNDSEIYNVGDGFARLTHLLNPGIVNWARGCFPNSPIFVRLDPHFFSKKQPPKLLTEATLVPANPKWLADFSLRKGMKEFAAYCLDDVQARDDPQQFWDYRIRGIRRLEVRVERRDDNYLTIMIEELPRDDSTNGLMVGRCIHLDTADPVGTPLNQVKLNHLDLAINAYEGDRRQERIGQMLQNGKVVDASFRTHLFRIEQASFMSMFDFCRVFLRSQLLIGEWIQELMAPGTEGDSG